MQHMRTECSGPLDDDGPEVAGLGRGPFVPGSLDDGPIVIEYDHDAPYGRGRGSEALQKLRAGAPCTPKGGECLAFLWDGSNTEALPLLRIIARSLGHHIEVRGHDLHVEVQGDYQGGLLHPPGTILVYVPGQRSPDFYTSLEKFHAAYNLV
jgi:hypothetical protein